MNKYLFRGTHGEWELRPTPNDDDFSYEIRDVAGIYYTDFSTSEANAHLIAAAPELLQACIEMVDQLCGDQEAEDELEKGLGRPLYYKMERMKQAIHRALNLPTV